MDGHPPRKAQARTLLRMRQDGQAAVNECFLGILCVNITRNTCVRLHGKYIQGNDMERYDTALHAVASLMDPTSAARYLDLLSLESIAEYLREQNEYSLELDDILLRGELASLEFTLRALPNTRDGCRQCVYLARDVSAARMREHESDLENRRLLAAVDMLYSMILSVNLSENTCAPVLTGKPVPRGMPCVAGSVEEWTAAYEETLHPSFRQEFARRFSREALLLLCAQGGREAYMEHMQMLEGRYCWTFTHVVFVDNPYNDDVLEMTLCNLIDERIRMEQQEREYSIGAGALYEGSEVIDLESDEHTVLSARFAPFAGGLGKTRRERYAFMANVVHPDDQEAFIETFDTPALRRLLPSEGDALVREARVKSGGGYKWVSMRAQAFRDVYTLHMKCFFCFYDIDAVKRLQEERQLANARFTAAVRDVYARMYEADIDTDELWEYRACDADVRVESVPEGWSAFVKRCERELVHPDDVPAFRQVVSVKAVDALAREGKTQSHATYRTRERLDAPYAWCTVWLRLMRGAAGDTRVLAYVQDVDADMHLRSERMRALEEAQRAAERANEAKSRFLSSISHDIRTPMNAIIGMTELARAHLSDPARVREHLDTISAASNHLLSLINDVLDMSAIESGRMALTESEVDLNALMRALFAMCREGAEKKGLRFVCEARDIRDARVVCDGTRLNQVFINLLSNAVKFTQAGEVRAELTQLPSGAGPVGLYRFTCRDTGIGMSAEFIGRLYTPFERAHTATQSGAEGTGLGMAIARSIVRLLSGDIAVESREGAGTAFTVTLPLRLAARQDARALQAPAAPAGDLAGLRVLVVEDNDINMTITRAMLDLMGVVSTPARDGQEGLDAFAASPAGYFAAVLMDVQMPVMDGYAAARAIRALPRADAGRVPILAMTADAFAHDVHRALDAGMNAHIAKPVGRQTLQDALLRAVFPA